jgi:hypothetical protein
MPYALCPMPYALCPVVPHMRARKAICLPLVEYYYVFRYLKFTLIA